MLVLLVLALFFFGNKVSEPTPPAPITGEGFRVLIIEETQARSELQRSQLDQLTATDETSVFAFCEKHCIKDGYKLLDKDADLELLGEPWVEAWKLKGDTYPWLLVSNGKTGFSGPLPMTSADTITLMKKYVIQK